MIAQYQPNQLVAQNPPPLTYPPSVPVVVELQRLGDAVRYTYTMNVQPEMVKEQYSAMFALHTVPPTGEGETSTLTFQVQPNSSTSIAASSSSMQQQLPATFSVQDAIGPSQENVQVVSPVFTLQMSLDNEINQPSPVIVNTQSLLQGTQLNYYSTDGSNAITSSLYITEPTTTTTTSDSIQNASSSQATTPTTMAVYGSEFTTTTSQELQKHFRWNNCKLCNVRMRTMRNAIDHYSSRAHDRRVCTWLMSNIRTSHTATNVTQTTTNGQGDNLISMDFLNTDTEECVYCELCDLQLTSPVHARQHFHGRRHRLVANKISKPHGPGFYNLEGKWVRTNVKCFICPLCDVNITSESQMEMHVNGSKHQRRLGNTVRNEFEVNGSYVYSFTKNGGLQQLNPNGKYIRPLEQYQFNCRNLIDTSAAFFCEVCCVTLNHIKSVKQHEEGKKHCDKIKRLGVLVRL